MIFDMLLQAAWLCYIIFIANTYFFITIVYIISTQKSISKPTSM